MKKRFILLTFLTSTLLLSSCGFLMMDKGPNNNKDKDNNSDASSNKGDGAFTYRKDYDLGEEITHANFVYAFRYGEKNPNNHVKMDRLCDGVWEEETITAEATYSYNMWETDNPNVNTLSFKALVLDEAEIGYLDLLYKLEEVSITFYSNRDEETFSYVSTSDDGYQLSYSYYVFNKNFEIIYKRNALGDSHEDTIATWSYADLEQDRPIRVKERFFVGTDVYETYYFNYDHYVRVAQNIDIAFDRKGSFEMNQSVLDDDTDETLHSIFYRGTYIQEDDQVILTALSVLGREQDALEEGETIEFILEIKKSKLLLPYEVRSSDGNKMHINLVLEFSYIYDDIIALPEFYEE